MKNRINEQKLLDLVGDLFDKNKILFAGTTSGLLSFNGQVPAGEYFITNANENAINLVQKTNRKHRNDYGESRPYRIIGTVVKECSRQYGQTLTGSWQIPWHLINWTE